MGTTTLSRTFHAFPRWGHQGTVLRLGGIRWGPEMRGPGTEAVLEREAVLCTSFADILEVTPDMD